MAIFVGVIPATVSRPIGLDLYGQPLVTTIGDTMVKVVKFDDNVDPTAQRSEESASRGKVDERITSAIILFYPNYDIRIGDTVSIFGAKLKVDGIWPRYTTRGVIRHKQVSLHRESVNG